MPAILPHPVPWAAHPQMTKPINPEVMAEKATMYG
jgi:hypothetical protein